MNRKESASISLRPVAESDAPFVARITPRLLPGPTVSPRDRDQFRAYFERQTPESLASASGSMAYVAELDGVAAGMISAHLDVDYFTNHPRLYVDTLAVAEEVEGHGVGRALMAFIEVRANELGCREVVLDVFANNERARRFYERCGYAADHVRMAKSVDPV